MFIGQEAASPSYPYPEAQQKGVLLDPFSNTFKARIARAIEQAEQQLTDARRAKDIFEKFPELEELLNIMQKGRF
jgi:hypothetical protein